MERWAVFSVRLDTNSGRLRATPAAARRSYRGSLCALSHSRETLGAGLKTAGRQTSLVAYGFDQFKLAKGVGDSASGGNVTKRGRVGATSKVALVLVFASGCDAQLSRVQTQCRRSRTSLADFPQGAYSVAPKAMPSAILLIVAQHDRGQRQCGAIFRATPLSPSEPAAAFRRALRGWT